VSNHSDLLATGRALIKILNLLNAYIRMPMVLFHELNGLPVALWTPIHIPRILLHILLRVRYTKLGMARLAVILIAMLFRRTDEFRAV
jgi:hypothetical protein